VEPHLAYQCFHAEIADAISRWSKEDSLFSDEGVNSEVVGVRLDELEDIRDECMRKGEDMKTKQKARYDRSVLGHPHFVDIR
jgi:hypothetical protein